MVRKIHFISDEHITKVISTLSIKVCNNLDLVHMKP